jgi:TrpR-related protein YerC/YecD
MKEYSSKLESTDMDFLFEGVLSLQTKEECYRFFEDICTINEIKALEQRLQVAKMLTEKRTYLDIASTTGASTATISRINRSLNYGNDGYKLILERLKLKK